MVQYPGIQTGQVRVQEAAPEGRPVVYLHGPGEPVFGYAWVQWPGRRVIAHGLVVVQDRGGTRVVPRPDAR